MRKATFIREKIQVLSQPATRQQVEAVLADLVASSNRELTN